MKFPDEPVRNGRKSFLLTARVVGYFSGIVRIGDGMILNFPRLRGAAIVLALVAAGSLSAAPPAFAQDATTSEEARARLIQYEPGATDLAAIAAQEAKTVVFFFASWCPNCILTLSELSEKWSQIEPDITLVIADYDTEAALKSKYGVTYQDTFVLLDSQANGVKLWNAGGVAGLNENTR